MENVKIESIGGNQYRVTRGGYDSEVGDFEVDDVVDMDGIDIVTDEMYDDLIAGEIAGSHRIPEILFCPRMHAVTGEPDENWRAVAEHIAKLGKLSMDDFLI